MTVRSLTSLLASHASKIIAKIMLSLKANVQFEVLGLIIGEAHKKQKIGRISPKVSHMASRPHGLGVASAR